MSAWPRRRRVSDGQDHRSKRTSVNPSIWRSNENLPKSGDRAGVAPADTSLTSAAACGRPRRQQAPRGPGARTGRSGMPDTTRRRRGGIDLLLAVLSGLVVGFVLDARRRREPAAIETIWKPAEPPPPAAKVIELPRRRGALPVRLGVAAVYAVLFFAGASVAAVAGDALVGSSSSAGDAASAAAPLDAGAAAAPADTSPADDAPATPEPAPADPAPVDPAPAAPAPAPPPAPANAVHPA